MTSLQASVSSALRWGDNSTYFKEPLWALSKLTRVTGAVRKWNWLSHVRGPPGLFQQLTVQRTSERGLSIPETTDAESLNRPWTFSAERCLQLGNKPQERTTLPFKASPLPNFPLIVKNPHLLSRQDLPQVLTTACLSFLLSTSQPVSLFSFSTAWPKLITGYLQCCQRRLLSPYIHQAK